MMLCRTTEGPSDRLAVPKNALYPAMQTDWLPEERPEANYNWSDRTGWTKRHLSRNKPKARSPQSKSGKEPSKKSVAV